MTNFVFPELVNDPPATTLSAALGATATGEFGSVDEGKAVKLGSASNYVLAVTTDEIEGFVSSVSPSTVNDGFSFGGVQIDRRMSCLIGPGQGAAMVVGDLVVADTQVALGTAGKPTVITGTPATFIWRAIEVGGSGAAGDTVLIERV